MKLQHGEVRMKVMEMGLSEQVLAIRKLDRNIYEEVEKVRKPALLRPKGAMRAMLVLRWTPIPHVVIPW